MYTIFKGDRSTHPSMLVPCMPKDLLIGGEVVDPCITLFAGGEKMTGLTSGEEEVTVFAGGENDEVWTTEQAGVEETDG